MSESASLQRSTCAKASHVTPHFVWPAAQSPKGVRWWKGFRFRPNFTPFQPTSLNSKNEAEGPAFQPLLILMVIACMSYFRTALHSSHRKRLGPAAFSGTARGVCLAGAECARSRDGAQREGLDVPVVAIAWTGIYRAEETVVDAAMILRRRSPGAAVLRQPCG